MIDSLAGVPIPLMRAGLEINYPCYQGRHYGAPFFQSFLLQPCVDRL